MAKRSVPAAATFDGEGSDVNFRTVTAAPLELSGLDRIWPECLMLPAGVDL